MPITKPLVRLPGETDVDFAARNDRRDRHNASSKQSKQRAIANRNVRISTSFYSVYLLLEIISMDALYFRATLRTKWLYDIRARFNIRIK